MGDVEIASTVQPLAVGGGVGGLAGDDGWGVRQVQGVGETLSQACHRLVGAGGVGEGDVQPCLGEVIVGRIAQEVLDGAGQAGQRQP